MNCCQCQGIEIVFNQKVAVKDLKQYRKKGAAKTTRMLIEALKNYIRIINIANICNNPIINNGQ